MTTIVLALLLAAQDPFLAGFASEDITPPLGTPRQGSNSPVVVERVLDPIFARAAVFESGGRRVGLVQLDLAMIPAAEVAAIRARIEKDHGVAADRVLVAATHNHAGPALEDAGLPRSEPWVASMVEKAASAFGKALAARRPATAGAGRAFEWEVAFNRRVMRRDGTVRTHGSFKDPESLAFEGPVDPEVGVFAVKDADGAWLGAVVNFACHPSHYWDRPLISAGWPGAIERELRAKGVPVTLFLQGAAGNLGTQDPRHPEGKKTVEEIGKLLAEDAWRAIGSIRWGVPDRVEAASTLVPLDVRRITAAELEGTAPGVQRFGAKGYYAERIPKLAAELARRGTERAEVQVLRVGDSLFVAQPSESFAEFGLRIKAAAHPLKVFVAGYANGMVGYLPTVEGFCRGGYEASFGPPSCMAPDTGDRLAEAAIDLARSLGAGGRKVRILEAPAPDALAGADRGEGLVAWGCFPGMPGVRPGEAEPEGDYEVVLVDAGHEFARGLPKRWRFRGVPPSATADPDGPGIQVVYEARSLKTGRIAPAVWTLRHPAGRVVGVALPPEAGELRARALAWASR